MDVGMIYSERVISVGSQSPLAGVLNSPKRVAVKSPGLILLNSGLMHHVGTCNLSVKIARSIVSTGIRSFRFDTSGIGDSITRTSGGSHEEREVSEIREVMDELSTQEGITQFVLCGLCSGADAALATAAVDSRVIGIIQIDPMVPRALKWYFYHYYPRFLDFDCWLRLIKRLIFGKRLPPETLPPDYVLPEPFEEVGREPDQLSLTSAYRELVNRGVRVLVIMTSGQADCYNALGQFRESFRKIKFDSLLEEHFLPHASHIITGPEDQRFLVGLVMRWTASLV